MAVFALSVDFAFHSRYHGVMDTEKIHLNPIEIWQFLCYSLNLAACGGTFFDRINKINKIFFYFYPEYPVYPV